MLSDFFDRWAPSSASARKPVARRRRPAAPHRVLLVDSLGAVAGGLGATSSNTTYIESAAGVSEGGRTGFTSVVVGALFLVFVFFAPIVTVIPQAATAPALVVVGYLMFTIAKDIEWGDMEDLFPAMLVMIVMPLTYSITDGIAAGFVACLPQAGEGQDREVHPLMWPRRAFVLSSPWLIPSWPVLAATCRAPAPRGALAAPSPRGAGASARLPDVRTYRASDGPRVISGLPAGSPVSIAPTSVPAP
jgi:xanthine/uracil/vitamin C permease (AzgA family)